MWSGLQASMKVIRWSDETTDTQNPQSHRVFPCSRIPGSRANQIRASQTCASRVWVWFALELQSSSAAVFLTIPWERWSWVRHGGAPVDRYLWRWDNEWIERCNAFRSWKMSLTVGRTGNLMLLYPTSKVFPAGVRVRMTCGWRWWRLKCHFQCNFICL